MASSEVPARLMRVFLGELEERLGTFDADLLALEGPASAAVRAETVTRLFRDAHSLKGAAAAVGAHGFEGMCQRLEDVLAALRDGSVELDAARFQTLLDAGDALREAARLLAAGDSGQPVPAAALPPAQPDAVRAIRRRVRPRIQPQDTTLRVAAETLDTLLAQSAELLVAHHRTQHLSDGVIEAAEAIQRLSESAADTADARRRQRATLREVQRSLERIAAAMQVERARLERASGELDGGIRSIRMLPFGHACEGLERIAHDAAEATGKRVVLEVSGADVGVDRVTLERLRDPLVQLVRNAIDHGIELPDERVRLGKPAAGTVRLWARPRARNFHVEVSDDGRGLDLDALRRRVRERGLAFAEDDDLARAVFVPGISTSATVTSLSGRGVGLDVVRTEVEALSGNVEVASTRDGGTRFLLILPLTVSTLRVVLFTLGDQTFGVGVQAIERVARIGAEDISVAEGRTVLLTGAAPIPLVPLRAILGIDVPAGGESERIAIVVTNNGRSVALAVDGLVDERQVHLRSLGPRLQALRHVAGASISGDGSIALILRSSTIVEAVLAGTPTLRERPVVSAAPVTAAKRVLLVDDSVTTRTLERSILEAAGFEVVTAADGAAAWQLLEQRAVDLVVSDVDMPRMDGFALIEAIRSSTSMRELPVILVTARENDADRRRGLEVGADAYIVKSSFRQEELLDAIGALA